MLYYDSIKMKSKNLKKCWIEKVLKLRQVQQKSISMLKMSALGMRDFRLIFPRFLNRIRMELQAEYDAQVAELKESWSAESQQQSVSANHQPDKSVANQNATQLATERVVEKFEVKMLVGGEQVRGFNLIFKILKKVV